jgi:hypothetical protein
MSLESKVAEYQAAAQIIIQCNAFQVTNFTRVSIETSGGNTISSIPFYMGAIDVAAWVTALKNQATAKRGAIKAEIIDILNSGV